MISNTYLDSKTQPHGSISSQLSCTNIIKYTDGADDLAPGHMCSVAIVPQ